MRSDQGQNIMRIAAALVARERGSCCLGGFRVARASTGRQAVTVFGVVGAGDADMRLRHVGVELGRRTEMAEGASRILRRLPIQVPKPSHIMVPGE